MQLCSVYCRCLNVGVHCTHGYNRTGFLIISYLVEVEDWRYLLGKAGGEPTELFIDLWLVLKLQLCLSMM